MILTLAGEKPEHVLTTGVDEAGMPTSPEKGYFVHETAVIDDGAEIGAQSKIWHFSHVLSGSHIGRQCNIGQNVMIGPDVTIGNNCKIQNNVSVYKGVTLEDGVFCGPSMCSPTSSTPGPKSAKWTRCGRHW